MANKTKDPVAEVMFGGLKRPIRWDYNTVAELQDLGYDFTPGSPDLERLTDGPAMPLKLIRAMCTAALRSGSDTGEQFSPVWVGRVMGEEGADCELVKAVMELMRQAQPEVDNSPLPESAPAPAEANG